MQYPLKPMSLGEILDTAFQVFTRNFLMLAGVGILMQAITYGLMFVMAFAVLSDGAPTLIGLILTSILGIVPLLLITPFGTAVSTKIIADRYLGKPTSMGAAFAFAFRILLPLLGAILLAGLLTTIGFICLIIPGIILSLRFALVGPAAVVEGRGGTTALRRSGELVQGEYGKIFLMMIIIGFASGIVQYAVGVGLDPESWLGIIVPQIAAAVIGAYGATVWTITYFERRCAKEGFDLQVLAEALGEEIEFPDIEEETDEDDAWATEQ